MLKSSFVHLKNDFKTSDAREALDKGLKMKMLILVMTVFNTISGASASEVCRITSGNDYKDSFARSICTDEKDSTIITRGFGGAVQETTIKVEIELTKKLVDRGYSFVSGNNNTLIKP